MARRAARVVGRHDVVEVYGQTKVGRLEDEQRTTVDFFKSMAVWRKEQYP